MNQLANINGAMLLYQLIMFNSIQLEAHMSDSESITEFEKETLTGISL